VFAVYVWLFALAVGVSEAVAGLLAALVGGGVFLLVRLYGEDLTRRRTRRAGS
jgi:4-amino-4-deoxy-L-arabinose transferase-like glycosyltransferase